jgi:hypothetical protein
MKQDPDIIDRLSTLFDEQNLAEFRRLLEAHPQYLRGEDGRDIWLRFAAGDGSLPFVQALVELGSDVNQPNYPCNPSDQMYEPEGSILHAASNGHLEVVRCLLDHGARINFVVHGKPRCLPLTNAVRKGWLEVVKLLVERGADIHADWGGTNAVTLAKDYGHEEIRAYLVSQGAKEEPEIEPAKETPMPFNFNQVRAMLKEAARATLEKLRADHPDETFYAFALYDAEGTCPGPSANSEEKWRKLVERKKIADSDERFFYRWSTAEWAYEGAAADPFEAIGELLRSQTPDNWLEFQAQSYGACIFALKELSEEGFFGSGASRITAFFSLSDDENAPWLEWESARRINPPEVFAAFESEWRIAVTRSYGDEKIDGGELAEVFERLFGPG